MRIVTKAKLKNFLPKVVSPSEPRPGTFRTIADGGVFLLCCKWKNNDLYRDVSEIVDAVGKFEIDVVFAH